MIEVYNEKALDYFTFKHNPKRFLYHKLRKPIVAYRRTRAFFDTPAINQNIDILVNDFSVFSNQYQEKGYCFVENLFYESSLTELIQSWPSRIYFYPSGTILKSYDFGFKWVRGNPLPKYFSKHSGLQSLFNFVKSENFSHLITEFCGDGIERSAFSFLASWATSGSGLIPHVDGISERQGGDTFLNIILFIDASGNPEDCGGTTIYEKNDYEKPLLVPTTLKNSALIYKSDQQIYHGFKPMKKNTYRWTINVQFCDNKFKIVD
jgi:hypothetical protein